MAKISKAKFKAAMEASGVTRMQLVEVSKLTPGRLHQILHDETSQVNDLAVDVMAARMNKTPADLAP